MVKLNWGRMMRALLAALFLVASSVSTLSLVAEEPKALAPHEAEILIYLMPIAHQLRSEGMDIGWELQTGERHRYPSKDYFVFWVIVINAKPKGTGSVTIGYFAVNKRTADVCDMDLEQVLTSPELKGVQWILRRAHNIEEARTGGSRCQRN